MGALGALCLLLVTAAVVAALRVLISRAGRLILRHGHWPFARAQPQERAVRQMAVESGVFVLQTSEHVISTVGFSVGDRPAARGARLAVPTAARTADVTIRLSTWNGKPPRGVGKSLGSHRLDGGDREATCVGGNGTVPLPLRLPDADGYLVGVWRAVETGRSRHEHYDIRIWPER